MSSAMSPAPPMAGPRRRRVRGRRGHRDGGGGSQPGRRGAGAAGRLHAGLRRRLQRRRRHPAQHGQLALRHRHRLPRRRGQLGHRRGRDDDQRTANVSMDGAGHLRDHAAPGRGRQLDLGPDRDPAHRLPAAGRRQAAHRGVASSSRTSPAPRPPATGRRSGRSARRPGRSARPNWPSIGEIDIMEDVNGRSSVFGTLHCGPSIPGGPCNETTGLGSGEVACPGCQTGFHTYGMEWDRSVTPGDAALVPRRRRLLHRSTRTRSTPRPGPTPPTTATS